MNKHSEDPFAHIAKLLLLLFGNLEFRNSYMLIIIYTLKERLRRTLFMCSRPIVHCTHVVAG